MRIWHRELGGHGRVYSSRGAERRTTLLGLCPNTQERKEMTLYEAQKITDQIVKSRISCLMGGYLPLPKNVLLEDMLIANRMVAEDREKNPSSVKQITVDPRGIALNYAFEAYGQDAGELLAALGIRISLDREEAGG